MARVSASIVLYQTIPDELRTCLRSMLGNEIERIYIIDNSPTNQLRIICEIDPRIVYIFNNENVGYGAGHNIAIRKSQDEGFDYHLVANHDIWFDNDVITKITDYMEGAPQVGQLIPNTIYPDGRLQYVVRMLPTPFVQFARRFMPESMSRRLNYKHLLQFADHTKIMNIPYHQGSFMFFRHSALRKVGLFDERYFMYSEDIDLTRRMHRHFETIFWPGATIVHAHRSASYKSLRMTVIHMVNMVRYFNKWGWFNDPERKQWNAEILRKYSDGGCQ